MSEATANLSELLDLQPGQIVAVIGAGGKHTLMYRLAQELAAADRPVVITSTTNLHTSHAGLSALIAADHPDWTAELQRALAAQKMTLLAGGTFARTMCKGLAPEHISRITAAVPAATVLVKADGARKRLLKAPAPYEPVYPPHVDVCVLVLSLAAIDKPFEESVVHRLDRVTALTGGPRITAQTLVDVILQPGGYADRLPPDARRVLYLSCCLSEADQRQARAVCELTREVFDRQVTGDTLSGRFLLRAGQHELAGK